MTTENGSSTLIVALIAIVVIVVLGLFALRLFPSIAPGTNSGSNSSAMNIDLNVGTTGGGQGQ